MCLENVWNGKHRRKSPPTTTVLPPNGNTFCIITHINSSNIRPRYIDISSQIIRWHARSRVAINGVQFDLPFKTTLQCSPIVADHTLPDCSSPRSNEVTEAAWMYVLLHLFLHNSSKVVAPRICRSNNSNANSSFCFGTTKNMRAPSSVSSL